MFFVFNSQFFWYRLVFLTELLIAEGLFTFKLRRRSGYAWRMLASIAALYIVVFCMPVFTFTQKNYLPVLTTCFTFLFIFALTVLGLFICYKEPLINIIFCALAAYCSQHIAYEV